MLDVVPNHMAANDENPFWRDPELRAPFFDVDDARPAGIAASSTSTSSPASRSRIRTVFETTHRLVLELVAEGLVTGCASTTRTGSPTRRGYLERLRAEGVEQVWVEKILEPGEQLRDWPVEGTTGYDFLNDAEALFVDPRARRR